MNLAKTILLIASTILFQFLLSYVSLSPQIGFDDANITQSYAQNIANGHGYVYNIGGERVEGSTSALWTLINVFAFFTPNPILVLHFISISIVFCTLFLSARISLDISGNRIAPLVTVIGFNFFPSYFGWGLFSLMDTHLFILLITCSVYLLNSGRLASPSFRVLIIIFLLPLARPEGIVVAVGLYFVWVIIYRQRMQSMVSGISIIVSALSSFTLITSLRLFYFGYPFPNTFYAKTSSDFWGQSYQGATYLWSWINNRENFSLLVLFALFIFASNFNSKRRDVFLYGCAVSLMLLGAILTYTFLGGDHFAGWRFYQFFIPLALSFIAAEFSRIPSTNGGGHVSLWAGLLSSVFIAVPCVNYLKGGGGSRIQFRIAEDQKVLAQRLSGIFNGELNVGVIPAGGFRMGYTGTVYDVLGLNWTTMAHAERATNANVLKNHGGFVSEVFLATQPELFMPAHRGCDRLDQDYTVNAFEDSITDGVTNTAEFNELYAAFCNENLSFFALRDLRDVVEEAGFVKLSR